MNNVSNKLIVFSLLLVSAPITILSSETVEPHPGINTRLSFFSGIDTTRLSHDSANKQDMPELSVRCKDIVEFKQYGKARDGRSLDLSNMDLREVIKDLNKRHIPINLKNAILIGSNLFNADLEEANLECANLRNAKIICANLIKAKLNGANLEGADLNNTDFSYAELKNANLKDANLKDADFNRADLSDANLKGAAVKDADFYRANLHGTGATRGLCWSSTIVVPQG